MRKIRIKNVQNLIHVVLAFNKNGNFIAAKALYDSLKEQATTCEEMEMGFTTQYGEVLIETTVKFSIFCKAFYRLESVTVNGNLIYGYSAWTESSKNQVIIEAE